MKYYVIRLLPPRPTFLADITAEERVLMQAHAEYWRGLMAEGKVVIFGPVADPAGPYGIGIIRLADGIDPQSIGMEDPILKAKQGFRFEVAPMLNAVLP